MTKEINGSGTTSEFTLDVTGNVLTEKRNGATYRTATYTGQRLSTQTVAGTTTKLLYDTLGNVDCIVAGSWASPTCPAVSSGGPAPAAELLLDNVYDYRSRLVASRAYAGGVLGDRTEYRYDPLARPIKKIATVAGATTATDLVYLGVATEVVRETETGAPAKNRSYAFDALGERATLVENGVRFSYVVDPHGSTEALLDQAGTVKASYAYLPYGEANTALTKTAAGFDASTNLYRYSGKRLDLAVGAYDMGARHYFPAAAHWFQQDSYADALANLALSTDPLTQNRYAFTGANPINNIELDGHASISTLPDGASPDAWTNAAAQTEGCAGVLTPKGNPQLARCGIAEVDDGGAVWRAAGDWSGYSDAKKAVQAARHGNILSTIGHAAMVVPITGKGAKAIKLGAAALKGKKAAKGVRSIDPDVVRFRQDSIKGTFKNGGTVDDLAAGLRSGAIKPGDVPAIRVVERDGQLFTLDNRRLEAFRRAGVPIRYRYATPQEAASEAFKFTTRNGGQSVRVRGG